MSCEIEEESPSRYGHGGVTNLDGIREEIETERRSSEFSGGGDHDGGAAVYVAVGNATKGCEESSMDALRWALKHAVTHPPSSFLVFLVNIFPETKHIPSPLGMIPMSQVNPEQKENHMAQERSKRSQFLHKFLDVCSASQVKVETILVESDTEAKAILDLIPICNIQKLVLGISKPNLRMRSKRGSCTADQILQNAPEFCQVKIICEGKEVATDQLESPSPSPSPGPSPRSAHGPRHHQNQTTQSESVGCSCFKAKVFQ